jgi:hypothetical protein
MKFHENLSNGSRVVACGRSDGRTHRHDKANSRFLQCCKCTLKDRRVITVYLILQVQFHPRNDKIFLVCPMRHAAVLVDTDGDHRIVPLDDDVSKR